MANMTEMVAKIKLMPEVAKKEILEAIRLNEGNREDAARTMGVCTRTFYRWIQELKMYEDIDALLRSMNLDVFIGAPRKYVKGTSHRNPTTYKTRKSPTHV